MKDSAIDWNPDFEVVWQALEKTNNCYFVTGKAGTGKSTLLRYFRANTKKKVAVLAPTGIAALQVKGQTIHSFFGFPPRPLNKKDTARRRNFRLYKNLDTIIIDEVSMVRVDWLDAIDSFLRNNRNSPLPFGGVQMIFFGDLFQLPPVVGSNEEATFIQKYYQGCPYFFGARVFQRVHLQMIELHEVYRQADLRFIRLLDAIRTQTLDYDDLEAINYRYQPEAEEDMSYRVVLSARNATVNYINKQELEKLTTSAYSYIADISGNVSPSALPAATPLDLKLGAQVMFLKNDQKGRYVNGTIGRISYLGVDSIEVAVPDSSGYLQKIDVEKHEWEIMQHTLGSSLELTTKVVGTFKQYPLRLAWAMTIHKSQGQTFEKVLIDLDKGAFEFGQTYVALSRCKSLEGILLKKPLLPKDVFVDGRVVDFYQNHR